MKLFHGIHEVRMLRGRDVFAGYFDSFDAALSAVENDLTEYKGAYFTLNPIDPERLAGRTINPPTLTRAYNTAADGDILRRALLLVDCDPPRDSDTNSTDDEKQSARAHAEHLLAYLGSMGWPDPMLGDSGNGWHLVYGIDLPNDLDAAALVGAVLDRLKQLFPMVDTTVCNAGRVCKLYGSWARKGPGSPERPWRRSVIVHPGSDGIVTEGQLRALLPAGVSSAPPPENGDGDANEQIKTLVDFLARYDVDIRSERRKVPGGWQVEIECPWVAEHTSGESNRDTVVSVIDGQGYGFKCQHGHCKDRSWRAFRDELESRKGEKFSFGGDKGPDAIIGGPLPAITHADLAAAFLRDNHDFMYVYDDAPPRHAQWVGTRWDVTGDKRPLMRGVADYLNGLFVRYPAPEKGPDARRKLKDAWFVDGVVKYVLMYMPPIRREVFDKDEYLLGLPGGQIIDLRTGAIREMHREDYITRRVYVAPDPNCQTPRWDRFLQEIMCYDGSRVNFLLRLGALCMTAMPIQKLFFLYGTGRNGKGVFIRVLSWILGDSESGFAVPLRPEQITVSRFDDSKRTFSQLPGKRLVTVNESVGGNLNFPMLKMMSGGDTLTGNKMRADAVSFKPTWKILLPTNDKPQLKAEPALLGRSLMIPFEACFLGREDANLEPTLKSELPGILYRFITLCPDVIENGLREPAGVMAATGALFDELDIAQQFRDDCLEDNTGAVTPYGDMQRAVNIWRTTRTDVTADDVDILNDLKKKPGVIYERAYVGGGKGRKRVWAYGGVKVKAE
jgi:P4 family phage/plasmid primase-like protien